MDQVNTAMLSKLSGTGILTDGEVVALCDYYNRLEEALSPCPAEYRLVLQDVRTKLDRLNEIKASRKAGGDWCTRHRNRNVGGAISVRV